MVGQPIQRLFDAVTRGHAAFRRPPLRRPQPVQPAPAETIVDAAIKHGAAFIGLSALMTTTMPQMKIVVELARARGVKVPVIVGGAAVDEAFAVSIGAIYAADAMATVRRAQELLKETGNA